MSIPQARLRDPATWGLCLLLALGLTAIWIAPRPPMIDLPQHAGQVALLRDMALGRSPWSGEVRINLITPYLIGYGLALPLAFVMPVAAALKTVLSLAYLGFVYACLLIGRDLGAPRSLNSYYSFSFFGFAFGWGMYTFLVATPVGLLLIWLCLRYARQGGVARGAAVALLGLVLLFSHGLVFLFACGVGSLLVLVRAPSLSRLVVRSWPFWILLAACIALFIFTGEHESAANPAFGKWIAFGPFLRRLAAIFANAFDTPNKPWACLAFVPFAVVPYLVGFRPDWHRREALVILGSVLAALFLCPTFVWSTALVFERFALFLPPAYAWILAPAAPSAAEQRLEARMAGLAFALCALVLAQHVRMASMFTHEERDFETLLASAQPGQRALALIYDEASPATGEPERYVSHALWYQADKHGFVDFNFAYYHPQIARFRPGARPPMDERLANDPSGFQWIADHGDGYQYVFMRGRPPAGRDPFAGASCRPVQAAAAGTWRLYERRPCGTPAFAHSSAY
jgi:hypothetical protein